MRFLRPLLFLLAGAMLVAIGDHFLFSLQKKKEDLGLEYFLFSDDSYRLRCIAREGKEPYENLETAMLANQCIAGSNGGFFHRNGEIQTPAGLLIDQGLVYGDQNYKSAITSATLFSEGEKIKILESSKFNTRSDLAPLNALQTGPFLVENFLPRKALKESPAQTATTRTFIGTDGTGRWILGYCKAVTLYQLAQTLVEPNTFPDFKMKTAINLDGGPSISILEISKKSKNLPP